jgi:tetratricopeptide (TPR) repeat protein
MIKNLSAAYFNTALQLARDNQPGRAVTTLLKAVNYDSENTEAWNLTGLCHYRLGNYKSARYCWQQSLQHAPAENPAAFYLNDLNGALSETAPWFEEVTSLCRQKKYGPAATIFRTKICSRFPPSVHLLNYLGVLKMLEGKTKEAGKCWSDALSLDKENADAVRYLNELENRLSYRLSRLTEKIFRRNV